MRYTSSNIQKSKKKWCKNLVVPNNCVNTHIYILIVTRTRVFYFLSRFLSSIINNVPLASVGGVWYLAHAKFCFHKYLLEVHLFHQMNRLFLFGASSVQKGYFSLSVLAFLLVLCVLRGGRRFLIGSRVQGLKFKYSRLNKRTYPLNLKP
ncbi:hypothetical protein D1Y75_10835 [Riemerella anatipestifer]|nr:hypothetical protein [Riemerella anatipestifer]MSN93501.1 hypothetical protein [Riemerella anatipestifer]